MEPRGRNWPGLSGDLKLERPGELSSLILSSLELPAVLSLLHSWSASFLAMHPATLSLLHYTNAFHVLTPQRQLQLPQSCALCSCTQSGLIHSLSISGPVFWESELGTGQLGPPGCL